MKKYVKPELYYEDFELSQHIAGCSLQLNTTIDTCAASGTIDDVGYFETWFVGGNEKCQIEVEDYCYTNAVGSLTTINS